MLVKKPAARIDLHATGFSTSLAKNNQVVAPRFFRNVRATGAGGAWNAGNILGYTSRLSDACILTLPNTVVTSYLSPSAGSHLTSNDLLNLLKK